MGMAQAQATDRSSPDADTTPSPAHTLSPSLHNDDSHQHQHQHLHHRDGNDDGQFHHAYDRYDIQSEDRSLLADDSLAHAPASDNSDDYNAASHASTSPAQHNRRRDPDLIPALSPSPPPSSSAPSALRPPNSRPPRLAPRVVHFDLTPSMIEAPTRASSNGGDSRNSSFDLDAEDPRSFRQPSPTRFDYGDEENRAAGEAHHRQPLLTDTESPLVALANSSWGDAPPLATDEAEPERGHGPENGDINPADDVHGWAEQERDRPKSGLRMAFMNMANSIIGAGIIGQPYALANAGLLAGVCLLVGLTIVVDWTICLIVVNSKLSGSNSFQGTVEHCFGRPGLIAISIAQWAFAFGGMVAFGIIVGDTFPHVFTAIWPDIGEVPVVGLLANRQFVIVLFCMGVSYPLTLYRDISKLAKTSTLALVSMGIIVFTVLTQGLAVPKEDRGSFSTPLLTVNSGVFESIGVISFAFVCHHNSLLIYGSLKTPTIDRFSRVTHYSTGISMVFCLVMALAGFLTFGDKTLGNILNNFPANNVMVTISRLCFGLNMLTTLPLEAFVCREVMINYFCPPDAPFNLRLHVIISTGLVAGATFISLLTCDVGVVFELVGATSACAMAYVLPPLCYVKLTTRSWRTYVALAIVVFGCVVMAISLVQSITKIISGTGEAAKCM